ncbi:MAG: pyridoxal phosphate-dependent aminotransferase [Acidovorax sp.]|uniref:pyridoxal phosphate-dependent aminotransferase n=1 Tax=Acidovorax sp. TaxID=1872122 RepID=UPI0039194D60
MRQAMLNLEASRIREIANAGMGREDLLAFWFGESDEVTSEIIRNVAIDSLKIGETFYSQNLGIPILRDAIANYASSLHKPVQLDRIAVTSGGVSALMLACQALLGSGDEVVVITPVWPSLTAQPLIMGAEVHMVALLHTDGEWSLDLPRLLAAVTEKTKLLVVNSPNNPTGWTISQTEQQTILEHCRKTGTWILSDEVYERLYYEHSSNGCAPSFLDICEPDDQVVVVQSFSKSFLMTGWRLGWLVVPPKMISVIEKLIEFNTSCASVFAQRAGLIAIERQADITPRVLEHLRICRNTLVPLLQAIPGVTASNPNGGMYAFFKLDIILADNSLEIAKRLVVEAGIGLAPGDAFASGGNGWLRWCFATSNVERLREGAKRLESWTRVNRPKLIKNSL